MLQLHAKCLGVTSETVQGPTGSFVSTTIHALSGMESMRVRVGRDFPPADLPKEGEEFALEVVVSAFKRKDGSAGSQVTALRRASGRRLAPAANG